MASSTEKSVSVIASNPSHPKYLECFKAQTNKVWDYANFFLNISCIPGVHLPKLKEFSAENIDKDRVLQKLQEKYGSTHRKTTKLLGYDGDILHLPKDVAICVPIPSEEDTAEQHIIVDDRHVFYLYYTLPTEKKAVSLEEYLDELRSKLEEIITICTKIPIKALALPYKFNLELDKPLNNWVRVKITLEELAEKHVSSVALIVAGYSEF